MSAARQSQRDQELLSGMSFREVEQKKVLLCKKKGLMVSVFAKNKEAYRSVLLLQSILQQHLADIGHANMG